MKEKKYAQLLSKVAALKASLEFNGSQLIVFLEKSRAYSKELENNLHRIKDKVETNCSAEILQANISEFAKIKQGFEKTIEAQLLDYQKTIDKTEKTINENIRPILQKETTPSTFDIGEIRKLLDACGQLIVSIKQNLVLAYVEISGCQSKLAQTEQTLQKLDLPNTIKKTCQQLETLAGLIDSMPDREYCTDSLELLFVVFTRLEIHKPKIHSSPKLLGV